MLLAKLLGTQSVQFELKGILLLLTNLLSTKRSICGIDHSFRR
jgi:hypothetical protein